MSDKKTERPDFTDVATELLSSAWKQGGSRFWNILRLVKGLLEDSARHARNEEFYRNIVAECAELLGPEAYTCDDGSISESPLALKVVPSMRKALTNHVELSNKYLGLQQENRLLKARLRDRTDEVADLPVTCGNAPWNVDAISRQTAEAKKSEPVALTQLDKIEHDIQLLKSLVIHALVIHDQ